MKSRDPTRSGALRRAGRGLVAVRVHALHRDLVSSVNEHDVIGLKRESSFFSNWLEGNAHKLARGELMVEQLVAKSLTSPPDWLRPVIEQAVRKGVEQAAAELRTGARLPLDPEQVHAVHGFAAASEVEGIAGETARRLKRHVVSAVEGGGSPEALMRQIRRTLESITRLRLLLLVNTAVVRGVNAGKLFLYANSGITHVGIIPEWLPSHTVHDAKKNESQSRKKPAKSKPKTKKRTKAKKQPADLDEFMLVNVMTAEDDRVCDACDEIADNGPYLLEAARDLIPAHPNCRCAFVAEGGGLLGEDDDSE